MKTPEEQIEILEQSIEFYLEYQYIHPEMVKASIEVAEIKIKDLQKAKKWIQ